MQTTATKTKISHHRADHVSILRTNSRRAELAFFCKGQWVEMGDPWLQGYWDGTHECPVYVDVPNWLVDAFLKEYAA